MYYIIHIATAYQSFKAQPREIQELIWARTLNDLRKKDPTRPLLSATMEQYLAKKLADPITLTGLLKKKMALTPEFGHIIGIGRALVMNGSDPKVTVAVARTFDNEKDLLQTFWQKLRAFTKERGMPTFVTWNGLGFTFPVFDREVHGTRSGAFLHSAPGPLPTLEASRSLRRARRL